MTATAQRTPKDAARELAQNGNPQMRFWRLCVYLGERREAAGEVCWDLRAWRSWIKAARAADFRFFGYVDRVEAMIAEGKTAEQIRQHFVFAKQADKGVREAEIKREREEAASLAQREREKKIDEEADKVFIREQARLRANDRLGKAGAGARRRVATGEGGDE